MKWHASIHPSLSDMWCGKRKIHYTKHAASRLMQKDIIKKEELDIKRGEVFEIESLPCGTPKLAIRKPYDGKWDVCYVLIPFNGGWKVVTCWKNKIEDRHFTLDVSLYEPKGAAIPCRFPSNARMAAAF